MKELEKRFDTGSARVPGTVFGSQGNARALGALFKT
jgi:hypothetical protein